MPSSVVRNQTAEIRHHQLSLFHQTEFPHTTFSSIKAKAKHIFHSLSIISSRKRLLPPKILETFRQISLTELIMEEEKKRKRADDHGGEEKRRRSGKEVPMVAAAAPQPSEEEVEEFFTILRRMNVAVKYFENSGSTITNIINEVNGDGCKMTELAEDGVDGDNIGGKRDVVAENGGLDLNAVPEAES